MLDFITLDNGIKLVLEEIPFVRSIAFGVWVKNGSRNEDENTNGISHFMEHMLFKGTENRTAKEIADEMDSIGGQLNAYTAKEYTCYYTRTLDTHIDKAVDILADMILNSKFDENDIQKECNVIIEEISMYEDAPEDLVHDILQSGVWKDSSLGYPIIGTADTISKFNKQTFRDYFNKNYQPKNMVIAIAGNFKSKDIIKTVEKYFGDHKSNVEFERTNYITNYSPCVIKREKEIEQVHLLMAFPGLELGSDNSYTLAILNTIFGGGMSSRLFQSIREEHGLAYSVYSYNSSFINTGLFSIYAGLNAEQTLQVVSLITEEINKLYSNKITVAQLDKTKEQLKSNYIMSLESSSNRMSSIGRSKLMLDRILTPDQIIEEIDSVNVEKLYNLIDRIFKFDNCSITAVGNLKDTNLEEIVNKAGIRN